MFSGALHSTSALLEVVPDEVLTHYKEKKYSTTIIIKNCKLGFLGKDILLDKSLNVCL
jgi:hypothetical protein